MASPGRDRPRRWHGIRIGGALLGFALASSCAVPVKVLTPLPANVRVVAPSTGDVPERIAGFSGAWAGRYTYPAFASGRHSPMTQEIALVVERIRRDGSAYRASIIFSWDSRTQPLEALVQAGYQRHEVTITDDGALRFRSGGDRGLHTFRVSSGQTLSAEQEDTPGAGPRKVYGVLWRVPLGASLRVPRALGLLADGYFTSPAAVIVSRLMSQPCPTATSCFSSLVWS